MVAKDPDFGFYKLLLQNAKFITNWAVIGLLVSLTYANQLKRCACYVVLSRHC